MLNPAARCSLLILLLSGCTVSPPSSEAERLPNLIVIFCDDVGFGDIGAFGHPTIATPHLDRMAEEGQRWTNFYVGAAVCTPSRAALMTGRLPIRSGMMSSRRRVLFPDSGGGLPDEELTLAEMLKTRGYATGCFGKWHLGHLPQFLPTRHGFDSYFGIPYSNDMDRTPESPRGRVAFEQPNSEYWNVPLMRGEQVIERPANQETITRRYTEEALAFIDENVDRPFFVYLAHSMAHVPLFASESFDGKSIRGLYGDVMEEIDWSVGQILDRLRSLKIEDETLVVFTSDNGPWLVFDQQGGSAGLLRGGKGETWEGGMREPTLFWWPGRVRPGVVMDMAATMDLLPTFAQLAEAELPEDRVYDGYDLSPLLFGTGPAQRDRIFYYREEQVFAARKGPFKAHFITQSGYGSDGPAVQDPPLLYNLEHDPSEKYDLSSRHPEVIEEIMRMVEEHRNTVVPVVDQLAIPLP
ncbi:MAG: sulfatase [Acidobacteriota bacterium]|nr:MAG: sulfatase [Acidobacteriota bacterium]